MLTDMIIRKNNALTDGNIPDRKVLTEKVANVLYYNYEQNGAEFTLKVPEILRSLDMDSSSGQNKKRLSEALDILISPITVRNFEYQGERYKWMKAPFLSEANILEKGINEINFKLHEKLIEVLKQQQAYTEIDINLSNKFKTKYGITLWQMYLRYKGMKRKGVDEKYTYQEFTLDDLNGKFATNYKTQSEMMRCINRGLKEVKKITDKDLFVKYDKKLKCFRFIWERELSLNNPKEFREHIRQKHKNEVLLKTTYHYKDEHSEMNGDIYLAVDNNGHLIDYNDTFSLNADEAEKYWQFLFENQNKIMALKQGSLF